MVVEIKDSPAWDDYTKKSLFQKLLMPFILWLSLIPNPEINRKTATATLPKILKSEDSPLTA